MPLLTSLLLLAPGCGLLGKDDDGFSCGEGTHAEDGECVADATPEGDTDTGVGDDTAGDSDTSEDTDSGGGGDSDSGDSGADVDWTVCDDGVAPYTDIQDAVDDAADGDVVVICPGTYDWVTIDRTDVTLWAPEGREVTFIDGGSHTALTLDGVEVTLSGLTLTGAADSLAGGIYATDARLTVEDSRINGASNGAVVLYGGQSSWTNVVIDENTNGATFVALGNGDEDASIEVRHCVFRDNSGATVYLDGVDLDFRNNVVATNEIFSTSNPMTFNPQGHAQRIWNNVFYDIDAPVNGHSLRLGRGVDFQNNIVAGLDGSVIVETSADASYNDYHDIYSTYYASAGVHYDDGGQEANSVTTDPSFTDPDGGDFTLEVGFSACIDAGNPLSGHNDADGTRNDMGAFGGADGDWSP